MSLKDLPLSFCFWEPLQLTSQKETFSQSHPWGYPRESLVHENLGTVSLLRSILCSATYSPIPVVFTGFLSLDPPSLSPMVSKIQRELRESHWSPGALTPSPPAALGLVLLVLQLPEFPAPAWGRARTRPS